MEKKYVLAIDQSTQGTKAILFDKAGNMTCRTEISHRQIISDKGWVSHDLDEIYENVIGAAKGVVEKAGIAKEEIACLGLSNQRETSAAWDRKTGSRNSMAMLTGGGNMPAGKRYRQCGRNPPKNGHTSFALFSCR